MKAAAYVISLSSKRYFKSPFEIWYGDKPNLDHLRILGCITASKLSVWNSKLDSQSVFRVFSGYTNTNSKYIILNSASNSVETVRDVQLFENKPGSELFKIREKSCEVSFLFILLSDFPHQ